LSSVIFRVILLKTVYIDFINLHAGSEIAKILPSPDFIFGKAEGWKKKNYFYCFLRV